MYQVIEFEDLGDGGGLSVVRGDWVTPRKKECLWPPYKVAAKFNKCLVSKIEPNETWTAYPIKRILYETDDLMKARNKCKKAESESELVTDAGEDKIIKRKRKLRPMHQSDSENDDEDCYSSIKFPMPPQRKLHEKDSSVPLCSLPISVETFHVTGSGTQNDNRTECPTPSTVSPQDISSRNVEDLNVDSLASACSLPILFDESYQAPTFSPLALTPSRASKSVQKPIIEKINASLDLIAKHLCDLHIKIKGIQETQSVLLQRTFSTYNETATSIDEISLPLKSVDDINNIESWLEEEEKKESLIKHLSYIGGNKVPSITRRVLERVFSNPLALKCNWTGKNNKFALKNLRLIAGMPRLAAIKQC